MNAIIKSKSTRLLSAFLAVLMVIAMLPVTAFAWSVEEGTKCISANGDLYTGSDGNHFYFKPTHATHSNHSTHSNAAPTNADLKILPPSTTDTVAAIETRDLIVSMGTIMPTHSADTVEGIDASIGAEVKTPPSTVGSETQLSLQRESFFWSK